MAEDDLILVTDSEIFGFRKRRKPSRPQTSIKRDLVSTLEVGDYLVHADHGIARFGGLIRRSVDGVEREYLELQYAEGDRLYVPADQLDRVSPYVGPADTTPTLTRLGSGEWTRTKRRVRAGRRSKSRSELLDLYATREIARGARLPARQALADGDGSSLPFRRDAGPARGDRGGESATWSSRGRWTASSAATSATARRRSRSAPRSRRWLTASRSPCSCRRRCSPSSTPYASASGSPASPSASRCSRASAMRSRCNGDRSPGIANGDVDIVIGTHRLLQKDVEFKDLGLVIDRRGAALRRRATRSGSSRCAAEVDVLTLSATPIPRTLHMSLGGHPRHEHDDDAARGAPARPHLRHCSGTTTSSARRSTRELERGGQVFFVHNRVHDIERIAAQLRRARARSARSASATGRCTKTSSERVMIGVRRRRARRPRLHDDHRDRPRHPERQHDHHQRCATSSASASSTSSGAASAAARTAPTPTCSTTRTAPSPRRAQKRLEAIFEATELGAGFQIALRDLEIRGAGNLLGAEQSGHIAAVGFDLYSKLMAEAVDRAQGGTERERFQSKPRLPPDASRGPADHRAHPGIYVEDLNDRLALYQRIAADRLDARGRTDAGGTARTASARRRRPSRTCSTCRWRNRWRGARISRRSRPTSRCSTSTCAAASPRRRKRPSRASEYGQRLMIGPNQVRIDRVAAADEWQQWLVRILRTMAAA